MTSSVALCLVVKNEAASLGELIKSAAPLVDLCHVYDTGSTDATIQVARAACRLHGLPFALTHGEFVDYSSAYNAALDATADLGCEWTLHLMGDMTISAAHDNAVRKSCDAAIGFEVGARDVRNVWGEWEWSRPMLTRAGAGWRYVGRAHEALVNVRERGLQPLPARTNFRVRYSPRDTQADWQARARRDVELLRRDYCEAPSARLAYYIGQSLETLRDYAAAKDHYLVATGTTWAELKYCALVRLGHVADPGYWEQALEVLPRLEAPYELALHYAWQARGAVPPDVLPGPERDARLIDQRVSWIMAANCAEHALYLRTLEPRSKWRMHVDAGLYAEGGKLDKLHAEIVRQLGDCKVDERGVPC